MMNISKMIRASFAALLLVASSASAYAGGSAYDNSALYTPIVEEARDSARAGNRDAAAELYAKELKRNPQNYVAHYFAVINKAKATEAYTYNDMIADMQAGYKMVNSKDKEFTTMYCTMLGALNKEIGNTSEALSFYTKAIKADPEDYDAVKERAEVYIAMGDYSKGEKDAIAASKISPTSERPYVLQALCKLGQGKVDDSYKMLNKLIETGKESGDPHVLRSRINAMKGNMRGYFYDALLSYMLGSNKGFDLVEDAVAQNYDKADREYVISTLKRAANADTTNAAYTYFLGRYYLKHGLYSMAEKSFKQCLVIDTAAKYAYEEIVTSQLEQGFYKQALVTCDQIMTFDTLTALERKSHTYQLMGEYKKAVELQDQLLDIVKDDEAKVRVYRTRGHLKGTMGNDEGAIKDATEAIKLDGSDLFSYLYRLHSNVKLGRKAVARQDYDTIMAWSKKYNLNPTLLGYACAYIGEKKLAEKYAQQLMEWRGGIEDDCYNAACIYSLNGDYAHAIGYLRFAFDRGFRQFAHLESDGDLKPIKEMQEYKEMVEEFKAKYQQELAEAEAVK